MKGWMKTFAAFGAITSVVLVWWNQPWFGYNLCLTKGIMHEIDFIDEMRPVFLADLNARIEAKLDDDVNYTPDDAERHRQEFSAVMDALTQCVAERGRKFCRYVGPDEKGPVYNDQEKNQFVRKQPMLFRYVDTTLPGSIYVFPWGSYVIPWGFFRLDDMLVIKLSNDFGVGYHNFPGFGCSADIKNKRFW